MTTPPPGHREAYGPQTWALIREAYLAGTPAPHLSRTFGPHVDTIRKRAVREGWTRTAHAAAQERGRLPTRTDLEAAEPPSPAALLEAALSQASALIAAGRPAEADAALRRAESLVRLAEAAARLKPMTLDDLFAARHELAERMEALAEAAAQKALTDPHAAGPMCDWAYRWRAQTLGPDCARADAQTRRARAEGLWK